MNRPAAPAADLAGVQPGPPCPICGNALYMPAPNNRLSQQGRPPVCTKCRGLERHRIGRQVVLNFRQPGDFRDWKLMQFSNDQVVARGWFKEVEVSMYGESNSIDIQQIDRPDGGYDFVVCSHVIEHVPDHRAAVRELARILSDRGLLFLAYPSPARRQDTLDWGYPDWSQHGHFRIIGRDFEQEYAELVPHAHVIAVDGVDPVTGDGDRVYLVTRSAHWAQRILASPGAERIHDPAAPAPVRPRIAVPATPVPTPPPAAPVRQASPDETDSYAGTCSICGLQQVFHRDRPAIRESYRCAGCKASLREREQAAAILANHPQPGCTTLEQLARSPRFGALAIYEPGTSGPFRRLLQPLRGYGQSDYYPSGRGTPSVPHVNLEQLPFADACVDLVISSDIFEHVRHPWEAFAEVARVLRPGGRHIFTVPLQDPMPERTVPRVDVSGPEDVHLLEPRYHGDGKGGKSLVYNDFGTDLLPRLEALGTPAHFHRAATPSKLANRVVVVVAQRPKAA